MPRLIPPDLEQFPVQMLCKELYTEGCPLSIGRHIRVNYVDKDGTVTTDLYPIETIKDIDDLFKDKEVYELIPCPTVYEMLNTLLSAKHQIKFTIESYNADIPDAIATILAGQLRKKGITEDDILITASEIEWENKIVEAYDKHLKSLEVASK